MFFRVFLPMLLLATVIVYTTISYDLWYELSNNQACSTTPNQSISVEDQIKLFGSPSNYAIEEKESHNFNKLSLLLTRDERIHCLRTQKTHT